MENSEAECLLGHNFLETNKCDPLFFDGTKARLTSVYSYVQQNLRVHKVRVIATATIMVPAGHSKKLPAPNSELEKEPNPLEC